MEEQSCGCNPCGPCRPCPPPGPARSFRSHRSDRPHGSDRSHRSDRCNGSNRPGGRSDRSPQERPVPQEQQALQGPAAQEAQFLSAYSTPPQAGTTGTDLILDRNASQNGTAVTHDQNSPAVTLQEPGVLQCILPERACSRNRSVIPPDGHS